MKVKKGDTVRILSGSNKGKKGKIIKIFTAVGRVTVEGINLRKKHNKARKTGQKGSIIEFAAPLSVSNVALICPECSRPTRVGRRVIGDKKIRVCKKCNQEFE